MKSFDLLACRLGQSLDASHRDAATFFKSLRGVEQSSTALTGAAGGKSAGQRPHAPKAVAAGAVAEAPCPPLPQAKPRALWHPKRGTYVPPFWEYGKAVAAGLGCRLGCCLPVADAQHRPKWQRRPVLNGAHRAPGPLATPEGLGVWSRLPARSAAEQRPTGT